MTQNLLLERFQAVVKDRLGLVFDESRLGFLENVLRQAAGSEPAAGYLRRLESQPGPADLEVLVRELTVTETYFFRHWDQLQAYAQVVLPERLAAGRRVSVLSAGCSSGEEPYSLAILAGERPVSVLGIDINSGMLEKARRGLYSPWALRETPPELQERWFRPVGKELALHESVLQAVRFEQRNLIEEAPDFWRPGAFDVIFCRNVLMYLDPEVARAVVARMARSLTPGGALFLGYAENLRGLSGDFNLCHHAEAFYYTRRDALHHPSAPPPMPPLTEQQSWVEMITAASKRIQTLSERAPIDAAPPGSLAVAQELLRQERFGAALEQIRDLPADPDVLLLRAVLLTHGGQLDQAEEVCRRLLEEDDMRAGAHYILALCREASGDRAAAVSHNQVACHLDPGFAMPHLQLGLLARRSGDLETARRELGRAQALLQREDTSRLLLFGGGFSREALLGICQAELKAAG